MQKKKKTKKYPCPDCRFCQWCSDSRCGRCRPPEKEPEETKVITIPGKASA